MEYNTIFLCCLSIIKLTQGHGRKIRKGEYADVRIPPSLVPPNLHITEESLTRPTDIDPSQTTWDGVSGSWHTVLFPVAKPSSRKDVKILQTWMENALAEQEQFYEAAMATATSENGGGETNASSHKDTPAKKLLILANGTIPILTMTINEIVRQVSTHCVEQGELLDKVWRSFLELFDRILLETKTTVKRYQKKMQSLQDDNKLFIEKLQRERERHQEALGHERQSTELRMNMKLDSIKEKISFSEGELTFLGV